MTSSHQPLEGRVDSSQLILPTIDSATLGLARAVIQITLAGLILWTGQQVGQRPGARWLALGLAVHGLALLIHNLSYAPLNALLNVLNHMGFGFSSAFIMLGFWRFSRQPVRFWMLAIVVLIPALSLVLWDFWMPNGRYRILTTASGQVLFLLALRWQLTQAPRPEMEGIYRVLRWVVPAYTLLLAWAYASVGGLLPTTAQVPTGYHGILFSVGSMVFMLSLAVSFLALQYAEMACRYVDQARRDTLTGLLNRRGLFQAVSEHEADPADLGRLAVLALDADHFKAINDRFGHAVGDRVLQELSAGLVSAAGPDDLVARIGGEEFILLRHETDFSGAMAWAEQVRRRVESLSIDMPTASTSLTASIGVAIRRSGETVEQTITRADRALYDAKRSGRNTVALAELDG